MPKVASGPLVITAREKRAARQALLAYYLKVGLQTPDDLWHYIAEYLHFNIPRIACCPGHDAPFDIISELFFDKVRDAVVLGARGSGKTRNLSLLNHLDSVFKAPCEIASAASVLEQSSRGYSYFGESFQDELVQPLLVESIASRSHVYNPFREGLSKNDPLSLVQIISGTYNGLNGPHPNRFRCDEVELMPWLLLQEAFSMAISSDHVPAQNVLISTRKTGVGTMQRLLNEAPKRGMKVYKNCVFDVLEPCTRECKGDKVYGDCPAYEFVDAHGQHVPLCGGKAHSSQGHFKIDDFVKKVQSLDPETLRVQWFSEAASDAAMVYGMYYNDANSAIVVEPFKIPNEFKRVGGIDPQMRFAAVNVCVSPDDIMYVTDEYEEGRDRLLADHALSLRRMNGYMPGQRWWIDPSGKQQQIELSKMYNIAVQQSIRTADGDGSRIAAINAVKSRFTNHKLKIFKTCTKLRKAFGQFEYELMPDGTPNTAMPSLMEPDLLAALRYAVYSYTLNLRDRPTYKVWKANIH